MNSFTFRVDGKIKAKDRPRFNRYTGKAYTTKQSRDFENLIKDSYLSVDGTYFGDDTYLRLEAELYFSVPKSYTKKRRLKCISNIERPAKKPDSDNCLKAIADSLNEIAYKDDIQLLETEVKKYYTDEEEDYMIIRIIQLEGSK